MVTQLPSTGKNGSPLEGGGCDTSDLVMIHGMYRKVFGDAPARVRAVVHGNSAQRDAVVLYLTDISHSLHAHHHGEDELLWNELVTRAPSCAPHVGQMREQHEAVAALLDVLDAQVVAWHASGSNDDRDAVATTTDEIARVLFAHLGQEERDIVPVAQSSMPQHLWDKLSEHGRASSPRDRQLASLGHILSSMPPDEAAIWMKANLPLPVRLLWKLVGKRQFDAEMKAMTAT